MATTADTLIVGASDLAVVYPDAAPVSISVLSTAPGQMAKDSLNSFAVVAGSCQPFVVDLNDRFGNRTKAIVPIPVAFYISLIQTFTDNTCKVALPSTSPAATI